MTREQIYALAVRQMLRAQQKYFRCKEPAVKSQLLKISIARELEIKSETNAILHSLPTTLNETKVLKIEENEQQ